MCRRRSKPERTVHFLDAPLHMNRIRKETLHAVLAAAEEGVPLARRAARLQAKAYGKAQYGPWDQRAPAPDSGGDAGAGTPYAQALDLIAESYGSVDPRMGEFVTMMVRSKWIEGTVGDRKRPGAYCTRLSQVAHAARLHDLHRRRQRRDHAGARTRPRLPLLGYARPAGQQRSYGMSIAETASTFGESVVRDALLARAETPAAALRIVWEEAAALVAFVLNIPTRFAFERSFYEARAERPQRPEELNAMMSAAWEARYGDCLAEPDPLFWANKLHFYISGLSFYNFPYLFGYLFSLGVYARREAFGSSFFERYEALLRDTGRMTTEELAAKHLEVDLAQPDFWRETLASLETRIDAFEALVEQNAA